MHRFIKAVGAGVKRARDLTRDEAREAMSLIAAGTVEPVQVGAFLLALRMKGESADELAGFVDALTPHLRAGDVPPGALDVDCHGDGHEGRTSLLPAAACAAIALGVPVVLRTDLANPLAKHGLRASLATLRVPVIDLAASCPPLHALVSLRAKLGLRTCAQTLCKLIDPTHAGARLVGVFHAPYLPSTARALATLGSAPAVCAQAIGGLPEASPGKQLRIATSANPEPSLIDLRFIDAPDGDVASDNQAALAGAEPHLTRAATAAALLLFAGRGTPLADGYAEARRVLADGRAATVAISPT